MANRLSQEKANAIASEYVTNGYSKTKALLSVGYKPSYANNNVGLKLFDNVLVKYAINKIMASSKANTDITVQAIQAKLADVEARARECNDRASELRAIELQGKTIAAFTDSINTNDTTQQKAIDEQAMLEAKRMAEIRLKQG
jgi:hypothetical protein